jgi:hypothetical protein
VTAPMIPIAILFGLLSQKTFVAYLIH